MKKNEKKNIDFNYLISIVKCRALTELPVP